MPEPVIEEDQGGIRVTFLKDIYTEEYLQALGLNIRQIKAVIYMKEHGQITNAGYQKLVDISRRTALRDLQELLEKQIVKRIGAGGIDVAYALNR